MKTRTSRFIRPITSLALCLVLLNTFVLSSRAAEPIKATLLSSQRIWGGAKHNAFTDLARFNNQWFCVFREGTAHVSPDGAIRVLKSADGTNWASAAHVTFPKGDLRDPKIIVTPGPKLMLIAAAAFRSDKSVRHQTYRWFSKDGQHWGEPTAIGEPDIWLWRVAWNQSTAFGIGYATDNEKFVRLYTSPDGTEFKPLVPALFEEGYPNETGLIFPTPDTAICLLRRDGSLASAQLGTSQAPFTHWNWKDLGTKIGGPALLHLPGNHLVAVVRLYEPQARTALVTVDTQKARLHELLSLPSGGDTSYAGMVWHQEKLWTSYYSSHEGKTQIYLAQIQLALPD